MVGDGALTNNKGVSKKLFSVLIFLVVVALVLVCCIVIINNRTEQEIPKEEVTMSEEATMEQINQYIDEMEKRITELDNDQEKAELYSERASYVSDYAIEWNDSRLKERVLEDAYKAEELNPTAFSAYDISYYEELFGNKDKADQYYSLAEKRGINDQIQNAWK